MATLRTGDTLELGGLTGPDETEIYARVFEIDNGDTVMSRTHILVGNGQRFDLLRTFEVEIVDILHLPAAGLLCLSGRGALFRYSGGSWSTLSDPIQPPARVSQLIPAGGRLHAIGPATAAYRLEETGGWSRLPLPDEDVHVLDLAQDPRGRLILCGTDGYLASLDGEVATRIDLPTDAHLCGVWCSEAGTWVCGFGAQLFHSEADGWEMLDTGEIETDFLQFVRFGDKLLMAAETDILEVLPAGIIPFSEIENRRLAVIGASLFSSTPDAAFRLTEAGWSDIDIAFDLPDEPTATAQPRG